jgi:hypothetical protein
MAQAYDKNGELIEEVIDNAKVIIQDVPRPRKGQKTTFEKINNLFKWFSVFSEWFASFGTIYKKHFNE